MATVVLHLGYGLPRFSWCSTCNLSTVLEVSIASLTPDGVSSFGNYRACQRCEAVG